MRHAVFNLSEPIFRQPDVLELTGVDTPLLQIWLQRGYLKLTNQNPGRGKFRLYSRLDVISVVIMAKLALFGIDARRSSAVAESVRARLVRDGKLDVRSHLRLYPDMMRLPVLRPRRDGAIDVELGDVVTGVVVAAGYDALKMQGERNIDADNEPVSRVTRRRSFPLGSSRSVLKAEPVLVMPIGEMVADIFVELDRVETARREGRNPWAERHDFLAALDKIEARLAEEADKK